MQTRVLMLGVAIGVLLLSTALPFQAYAQTSGNTQLDLLFEADTKTHDFYRGRSLPSANAAVRLYADARFTTKGGTAISAKDLIYTWSVNGRIMQNLSGKGRQSLIQSGPVLFGTLQVGVEAATESGALRASRSVAIDAAEPILTLYEDSALAGVMYWSAIVSGIVMKSAQTTLIASPYFISLPSSPRDITYDWKLGGVRVAADTGKPYSITLETPETRNAKLSLDIEHARQQFQSGTRSWQLFFSGTASGNPFNVTQ